MALTATQIQSLRFHLGYGNIGVGAFPYTSDGFQELFDQVIAPNLQGGTDTTATTAVSTANSIATVTVASLTNIAALTQLFVDVGDDSEIVVVKSVNTGASTFTALFSKAHTATAYPISTVSGESRLRRLLYQADLAWQKIQDASITQTAGIKQVDKGDVIFFERGGVLNDVQSQYRAIVMSISDIVRVRPAWYERQQSFGISELY